LLKPDWCLNNYHQLFLWVSCLLDLDTDLSHNWQDTVALFKVLLTLTLCSPSARFTNTWADIVPELYRHLCTPDGRILVGIMNNKPIYMDMPVFDVIYPGIRQPYINILRQSLNDSGTPAHKLAQSFNTVLTQAIKLILSFSWVFYDEKTLSLIPSRLLGAKILLCPADSPNTALSVQNLKAKADTPLALSGNTFPAPANSIGVTEVTLWERDEWLVALLTHGDFGKSVVITSETLNARLSLWRLLASSSTPIASDPLANLVFTSYRKYNESK
jgi:hypothetical protein